ncbi:hypothetical protein DFH09DRAFT_1172047 [Mycena vulgaris]|nr:hypothetical protein DFH09DRAFT_1172047 [Mycena vulgaris]
MVHIPPPLDESLYKPDDVALALIAEESGIRDPDALRKHILAVQAKAYNLCPYTCIRLFVFTRARISTLPAYPHVLQLARERTGAILLDLGCCFGIDVRTAARDGFPAKNILASDLRSDFWNIGHQLFRSAPATCPIAFLAGDAFDPDFLEPAAPVSAPLEVPAPQLAALTRLTPLHGHVAALYVSLVFHLFPEQQQLQLARVLAGLLSPLPGSVIFGMHVGLPTKGVRKSLRSGAPMFCHSPESWVAMWAEVFPEGAVRVDAQLQAWLEADKSYDGGYLVWCVTRV